jgi:16S rRNA (cytidine1402-2'-O)-methyltransferase
MKNSKTKPKPKGPARASVAKAADPKARAPARPSPEAAGAKRAKSHSALESGLYVVATPIGNLRDISLRALDVLNGADLIYAEDTRVSGKLLTAHGIKGKLSQYHEHNADAARPKVLKALAAGQVVALISDAGTPLVSDPGFKLVRAAADEGHRVIPIPGASAALAALVIAALPTDRFLFAGFTPSKSAARRAMFEELASVRATLIFYETGPRLAESLADMTAVFGQRSAAIARELTKLYEDVRRGALPDLATAAAMGEAPKGELVVLIGPPEGEAEASDAAIDRALRDALKDMSVSAAADEVSELLGVARRRVYQRALALKDGA